MKKNQISLVRTESGHNYLIPFVLVTILFFMWGFAHSILDVLNKHFQDVLVISKTRSALVQAVVYGGYFLMALPAGAIIKRYGYRTGVICGLLLYGVGALMFIPGEKLMSFEFFLFSLFVIGCGLTCLETAANPYVTVLGEKEGAARRLNLAQSFNGLGWIFGPLVGGLVIFGGEGGTGGSIAVPYAVIGVIVLLVAIVFSRIQLPEIVETVAEEKPGAEKRSLWGHPNFTFGVVSLFFYVAAQTGINSFFINYVTENVHDFSARDAALALSFGGMGLFMVGRMLGSWIMRFVRAERVLLGCALGAVVSMVLVIAKCSFVSVGALFFCFLCESIMFPTIFALALRGVGADTKKASSFLIMSIVGGAIAPVAMGVLGEKDMAVGFIIPLICFVVIVCYAVSCLREKSRT